MDFKLDVDIIKKRIPNNNDELNLSLLTAIANNDVDRVTRLIEYSKNMDINGSFGKALATSTRWLVRDAHIQIAPSYKILLNIIVPNIPDELVIAMKILSSECPLSFMQLHKVYVNNLHRFSKILPLPKQLINDALISAIERGDRHAVEVYSKHCKYDFILSIHRTYSLTMGYCKVKDLL